MRNLTLILVLSLVGCSTVTYQTSQGEKFTYSRVGAMSIQGVEVEKNENGITKVSLKQVKSDAGELASALTSIAETAVKGAK